MANVLLIGDDRERTGGVKSLLAHDGHRIAAATDVARWREEERAGAIEVVVAAVGTPEDVLSAPLGGTRAFAPPILFVHRESDDVREPHVEERLIDRIQTPFSAEEFLGRVDALIRVRRVILRQGEKERVDASAHGLARWKRALASRLSSRVPRYAKPPAPYLEVAARVADWSDRRDAFEPGHAERVTTFAAMIADEMALADGETAELLRAAMLHDIGKVALPVEVLRHRGPLEDAQIRLLRTHPERGSAILRALDRDDAVAETILHHHECFDGSGYNGLKGTTIPRPARILAVAEAFDAMLTSLVRRRLTMDAAIGLMKERRGSQWDPACVDALLDALQPAPRSVALSPSEPVSRL